MNSVRSTRIFYGWWIVVAAFLNLFFVVGVVFYGFPVFYPMLVESLGFSRAQTTQGFLLGFLLVGLPSGFLPGALIDRVGARGVVQAGIGFVGVSLISMGMMWRLGQYYLLCITEVLGYVLAGPIPNQVLIANWFRAKRGRAMGYAYLGLGAGGAVSPLLINSLSRHFGWRHAMEIIGALILIVLLPIGGWVTRSAPGDLGLLADGSTPESAASEGVKRPLAVGGDIARAVRSANFWLIVAGSTLAIGAIGAVIQHLILFLKDQGYSSGMASRISASLLASSLAGRVLVGYLADRFRKKNVMALFYLLLAASIPCLYFARHATAVWFFALVFGFSMGADYMLIPLVTAECFGLAALGKLLALIIMGYSLGQWGAPWLAGKIFDARHSYDLAWAVMTGAGVLGAATIYAVSPSRNQGEWRPEGPV